MDNNNIQQQLYQQQRSNKKYFAVIIMLLLVIGLSVGYAILSTSFNISGTSKIKDTTSWSISPVDEDAIDCGGSECNFADSLADFNQTTPDKDGVFWLNGNTIYFKHLLEVPGDTFTFTATFENNGTLNAKVASFGLEEFSTDQEVAAVTSSFLEHSVVYNSNNAEVSIGDPLNAGATVTFKVTVKYKSSVQVPPTAEQLAQINAANGAVTAFTVTYEQA